MCGIAGIYAYHDAANVPDTDELMRIRDHMATRGPDGAGQWWSGDRRLAFAHRRLSILDLSERGAQPMVSADERFVLTFNGEIYNHPKLRSELEAEGVQYRSGSDTETILQLYVREGAAMVERLRGMFAFAIWDVTKKELFLARDPYGIKPLYYANDGWTFRFASQVKALLAGGRVSLDPEPAGQVGFYLWGHVPEPFTLYRDIRAIPAGHTMYVDRWGPREPQRYASIAGTLAAGCEARPSEDKRASLVAEALRDSVYHHLLADVDIGVFLSAGVDSGAILGLVRDAGVKTPYAITVAFAEFRNTHEDEAPIAASVAELYGAKHIVRMVDQDEFRADLPAILDAMDQPSIDGVNTWFVAKAARETGLKVALSGLGGDELLAGYPSFTELPRWRRRYGLAASLPGLGRIARIFLRTFAPGLAATKPKALYMLDYAGSWEGAYLLRRGLFLPGELHQVLDPDSLCEGLRRLRPLEGLQATLSPDPGSNVARVCALESTHYLRDQLLRDADWAGMAHSVEIRTPLVDSALLKTLAPAVAGIEAVEGKRALAAAPSTQLPAAVVERAKTGFTVPTGAWMGAVAHMPGIASTAPAEPKGVVSRRWSQKVLSAAMHGRQELGA